MVVRNRNIQIPIHVDIHGDSAGALIWVAFLILAQYRQLEVTRSVVHEEHVVRQEI